MTELVFILDRSGSMHGSESDTIGGFNSMIEKQKKEELQKDNFDMLAQMKEALDGKVTDVRISSRLKSNPVCLVADQGGISMEMEKYLSQLPEGEKAKANKVLEINPEHAIFKVLQKIHDKDAEDFSKYTDILYLYGTASLILEA